MLAGLLLVTAASVQALDDNLTDPTQPARILVNTRVVQDGPLIHEYKLSQIYMSKKTQFAMINNQKLKVGDWLGSAEIVLIKSDRVHLLIDDTIKEITIMPSFKQYKK